MDRMVLNSKFMKLLVGSLALLLLVFLAGGAVAAVNLDSPDLPPDQASPVDPQCSFITSLYEDDDALHALFPGGIDFSQAQHSCFQNVSVSTDGATGDETESFDSKVTGMIDDGSGPMPIELTGPVEIVTKGKGGATTGSWDTEIVAMNLSGSVGGVPIEIRESPSLPSTGHTDIANGPGGTYNFDSFFDIWIELSVNGGPFQPQINGSSHMVLTGGNPPPVPSSGPMGMIVLVTALAISGAAVWRRKASMKG